MTNTENTCGCCEGLEAITPLSTANRPGLEQLHYRVGTHGAFLETMQSHLSSRRFSVLQGLASRDSSDPAIALLDAWALVADVLTFYQERIANEGYLRTATERRSVLELGRLVGYTLRPGVAATVYPAFMMEKEYNQGSEIPKGTRVQSIPGPEEMPQFFETTERIDAREKWNELKPRLTRPQKIEISGKAVNQSINTKEIYFKGAFSNLKVNDPLLFDLDQKQIVRHVLAVESDSVLETTKVILREEPSPIPPTEVSNIVDDATTGNLTDSTIETANQNRDCAFENLQNSIEPLLKPPSVQPNSSQKLDRDLQSNYTCKSDIAPKILSILNPSLQTSLYQAWENLPAAKSPQLKVYALQTKASPFGHNAPLRVSGLRQSGMIVYDEWIINNPTNLPPPDRVIG
jgi:hypothetical protein